MGKYNYSIENVQDVARGVGRDLSVSMKHSLEICSFIKGKNLTRAKNFLQNVVDKKEAVPFKKFNDNVGHKPGVGSARYPVKAAGEILKVLRTVESNAKEKGMDTDTLFVKHASANKASRPMRYGRHSRREAKRTHVEIALKENPALVKKQESKKKKKSPKTSQGKEKQQPKESPKKEETSEKKEQSTTEKQTNNNDSTEENKK